MQSLLTWLSLYTMARSRFCTDAFQAYYEGAGGCRCRLQQVMPDKVQLHSNVTGMYTTQAVT